MKKGFQITVKLLMAVLLLMLSVMIFWAILIPDVSAKDDEALPNVVECMSSKDCQSSTRGSACIMVYPDNYESFCGCTVNEDCLGKKSGVCGYDNRCV